MGSRPLELALYGKGGIGKSTICANLSAALAAGGKRILQIGCDPKHDSTRLLMGGAALPTVLDYLRETPEPLQSVDAVLGSGYLNIGCIEAGGPRPGVGCAGRGIISAFEFLEKNKLKERYDLITYDVLGDVVCGGFAVPIRREYADAIFLVTSGEFMALYAANNILRGVRNFDGDSVKRVAGIIFNRRNVAGEDERVERFAGAVGLPVCAVVPRSGLFAEAEAQKRTVMAMGVPGEERDVFVRLAEDISRGLPLHEACPLSDEDLERCVLEGEAVGRAAVSASGTEPGGGAADKGTFSPASTANISAGASGSAGTAKTSASAALADKTEGSASLQRPPLFGCAFNGAATTAIHVIDAVIIAHSPRSCAFYTWQNISSPGRRNLFNRGILLPSAISPNFESTEMDRHDAVFGGMDKLRESVASAIERRPGAVIVISSCVSGIIGDDVLSVEDMSTPELPVIVIPADGDISGDYMSGIDLAVQRIGARLIKRNVPERPYSVNLIGETGVSNYVDDNFRTLKTLLEEMGISINCRFLGDATASEISELMAAPLNILATDTPDNRRLKTWLSDNYGCHFYESCLPLGAKATESFLRGIGAFFGREAEAERLIAAERVRLAEEIEKLKPALAGKRVMMATANTSMDWLMDAAEQVGVEFVWVGVLNYLRQEITVTADEKRAAMVHELTSGDMVMNAAKQLDPDIILSVYTNLVPEGTYLVDVISMTQKTGFYSGIEVLKRWIQLLENRKEGDWVNDRQFFEKHYS